MKLRTTVELRDDILQCSFDSNNCNTISIWNHGMPSLPT